MGLASIEKVNNFTLLDFTATEHRQTDTQMDRVITLGRQPN